MKNQEIIDLGWKCAEKKTTSIHNLNGLITEGIVKECINRNSSDNLTLVIVCFKNFKKFFEESEREVLYRNNIANTDHNINKIPKNIQSIIPLKTNPIVNSKKVLSDIIKMNNK